MENEKKNTNLIFHDLNHENSGEDTSDDEVNEIKPLITEKDDLKNSWRDKIGICN